MITFVVPPLRIVVNSWKSILYIGLPTAGTRIVVPLSIGVITRFVASFGPEGVAAFGVSTRIEFFTMTVVIALSSVIGPFVGQNWGAGRHDRIDLGMKYSKRFSIAWGAAMLILLALSARSIAPLFNENPRVISGIVLYLMIVPIGFGLQGVLLLSATALNVLHRPFHAAILTAVQMFVFCIPLAYVGSHLFGLAGIFSAIALAYSLAGIAANVVLGRILAIEKKGAEEPSAG